MDPMMLILIFGGLISIVLLIVGVVVTSRSERSLVDERLGQYVDDEYLEGIKTEDAVASPLTDWVNVRVEKSKWGSGISTSLAQADLKLKPAEYIAMMVIAAVGVGAVAWFFGGKENVSGIIGIVVGLVLPRFYLNRQKSQRLIKFNEQLQDMLNLVVNGLRAGFSTVQALEAVSKELPAPISTEFRRVVQEPGDIFRTVHCRTTNYPNCSFVVYKP
jgi:tight adherence protein B